MLKKTITYEDFNGKEVTEDFYFNLSKAELVEIEVSHKGGLEQSLKKIVADEDGSQIVSEMRKLILKAYGRKSEDGSRFHKNPTIRDDFEASEAYSVLFIELCTEADAAVAFVNGIMPKGIANEIPFEDRTQPKPPADLAPTETGVIQPKTLTQQEVIEMDSDELKSGLATGRYILS